MRAFVATNFLTIAYQTPFRPIILGSPFLCISRFAFYPSDYIPILFGPFLHFSIGFGKEKCLMNQGAAAEQFMSFLHDLKMQVKSGLFLRPMKLFVPIQFLTFKAILRYLLKF